MEKVTPDLVRRRRGGYKARFTLQMKRLHSVNSEEAAMVTQREALLDLWEKLEKSNDDLLEVCREEEVETLHEEMANMQVQLSEALCLLRKQEPQGGRNPQPLKTDVKLPKLELPRFSGEICEWATFASLFEAAIDNHQTLTAAQKFQYLKSALSGEPESLIKNFPVTDSSYKEAWELLRNRYEHKRNVANQLVMQLINLPQIHSRSELYTLLDRYHEVIRSLHLEVPEIDLGELILSNLILQRLDEETKDAWELSLPNKEIPPLDELLKYLERRASASTKPVTDQKPTRPNDIKQTKTSRGCPICSQDHRLEQCEKFKKMGIDERWAASRKNKLCFVCLGKGHLTRECKAANCPVCNKCHHRLLHQTTKQPATSLVASSDTEVLLPTAIVTVTANGGRTSQLRALLDTGSQINIIPKPIVKKLGLRTENTGRMIRTVHGEHMMPESVTVGLKIGMNTKKIRCLVSEHCNINVPTHSIKNNWTHLKGLSLADPQFTAPRPIDLILGVSVVNEVLRAGLIRGSSGGPTAQQSVLGWIVSGPAGSKRKGTISCCTTELKEDLKKFWEIEEIPGKTLLTEEERTVERIYDETTKRGEDGRYEVSYPLKSEKTTLGTSREKAVHRFLRLERRLEKMNIKSEYNTVIQEYMALGHLIPAPTLNNRVHSCYLPHHPVFKESSTTKLRVVFDASSPTSSGTSLNDIMMNGPKLQDDLFHILIRFQTHEVAICADIEKMYRQIRVNKDQQQLQRIVWREQRDHQIKDYQLTRLTFGMKAAPYLAIKTIQQLALKNAEIYPHASKVLKNDFYVDDLLSGANSVQEARSLADELKEILGQGGFLLRKWCSNVAEIFPQEDQADICFDKDEMRKTLGILWRPVDDEFLFKIDLPSRTIHTKRTMLSDTARIFDPLGWLSPVLIQAKVLFQSLWRDSLTWDEPLRGEIEREWKAFVQDLPSVTLFRIPRYVPLGDSANVTLCGFCDASERAYGAVVYLRSQVGDEIRTKLLTAKSKVAPLQVQTIPRLELNAAVLLTRLMMEIKKAIKVSYPVLMWTDSELVLKWIAQPPAKWTTYVANRVSEIQERSRPEEWYHVRSKDNPADLISRGVKAAELRTNQLWWNGPSWLMERSIPKHKKEWKGDVPETRVRRTQTVACLNTMVLEGVVQRSSSLNKLLRIIAYVRRFIRKTRYNEKFPLHLTLQEMDQARITVLRIAQNESYASEIKALQNEQSLPKTSDLRTLAPWIDGDGLLRVGGRLQHADVSFGQKHQIIVPPHHHLTSLLIQDAHITHLHAAGQLTLHALRQRYWIPKGRAIVRANLHKCVRCIRFRAKAENQLMGQLPSPRVVPSRPFLKCGIDYCGPFTCKETTGRGKRNFKTFIAVFVCMVTKAVHLELVTALTLEAFLAALDRFTARRGTPSDIYSDNGRNFVAANRYMREMCGQTENDKSRELVDYMVLKGVRWHFIPPYSPHFGGLWEAAVKSLKYHLRRVCGEVPLTFEELTTLIAKVEACLNSRPLTAMTEDVEDLEAITPGHFLIGQPLTAIPECGQGETRSLRARYQLLQKLSRDVWRHWSNSYLTTLQSRNKWWKKSDNLCLGDMVIIREENTSPQSWKLGRVVEVFPDTDGKVRVVLLRTSTGLTRRAVTKLVKLPVEEEANQTEEKTKEQEE